jgi:predicted helicase
MKYYEEFKNLCFVDTLDNTNALLYSGKQENMFGLSSENSERIKRQNSKKISVVIGNPPYNANQANFNEFNKNRSYYLIDKRIKETFVKYSKASNKANLYDMYTRFYRWAMDRIDKNGVICLITNNSFINNKAFDGFRKTIKDEFDFAYIIDLGGNIRELSGKDGIWLNEEHTIFGVAAAVGIAIMFLVKKVTQDNSFCKINYIHPNDIRATRDEKLDWLRTSPFEQILFENITPKNDSWIKQSNNDFDDLIPLAKDRNSIFSLYSLGVNSNRDEWIYDFERKNLSKKMKYFISVYNILITNDEKKLSPLIKWSSSLENYFHRKIKGSISEDYIKISCFRPFVKKYHYQEKIFNHRLTQNHYDSFGINLDKPNSLICINVNGKDIYNLASDMIVDLHFTGDCQYFPLSQYDSNGNRIDNITDWGLEQFVKHYGVVIASPERTKQSTKQKQIASGRNLRNDEQQITKEDIFHYVYAVLHNPAYRKKYEINLKREFPRIPLYKDFWQWAKWGKQLMDIHINYEDAKLYPLKVIASEVKQSNKEQIASGKNLRNDNGKKPEENNEHQPKIKVKLRADKTAGTIEIDELTLIKDVPKEAWEYKLGNRSAIEWILDQYKEKKPSDPTIAEKFNTYKFAEYKDHVIELIKKVTTVSVETIKIIKEMESAKN